MVWHALLLNPAVYKKMLQHSAFPEKYRMQLPWAIVVSRFKFYCRLRQ